MDLLSISGDLLNYAHKQELLRRLATISQENTRRWGRRSLRRWIVHLKDAFEMSMRLRHVTAVHAPYPSALLHGPRSGSPYHGLMVPSRAGIEPGSWPARHAKKFAADVRESARLTERFTRQPRDFGMAPHPHFGAMSERDWMRLSCLHTDRHFRQLGV